MSITSDPRTDASPAASPKEIKRRRTRLLIGSLLALLAIGVVAALVLSSDAGSSDIGPTDYRVEFTDWPPIERYKEIDGYVESVWRDPAYADVIFVIDSRPANETGSPMANAQLARIQTAPWPATGKGASDGSGWAGGPSCAGHLTSAIMPTSSTSSTNAASAS